MKQFWLTLMFFFPTKSEVVILEVQGELVQNDFFEVPGIPIKLIQLPDLQNKQPPH